jgi:hypothetical protein
MSMQPPPDPDELASDLVDGLVTDAAEAARLRSDPAVAARIEAIEAVRAALRVPPPAPPGAVDRAMAATFAALDRGTLPQPDAGVGAGAGDPAMAPPSPAGPQPPPVTHLRSVGPVSGPGSSSSPSSGATPRAGRSGRSGSMPWLAAAAAIVFLGLVTIGILSTGSNDDDSTADMAVSGEVEERSDGDAGAPAAAESGNETAEQDGAGGSDSGPATTGQPSTTASPDGPTTVPDDLELGAVDSAAELADRVRARSGSFHTDAGISSEVIEGPADGEIGSSSCAGRSIEGDASYGEAVFVGSALLSGTRVVVHVYDDGSGDRRLVATDESCVDVVDMPFTD